MTGNALLPGTTGMLSAAARHAALQAATALIVSRQAEGSSFGDDHPAGTTQCLLPAYE